MAVQVDEARREGEAGAVDLLTRTPARCRLPDRHDPTGADGKIPAPAGPAGAVVDRRVADDDVDHDAVLRAPVAHGSADGP